MTENKRDGIWDELVQDIIAMSKFSPSAGLKKNETTIKMMAEKLENVTGLTWSHSKTRNRLERKVQAGELTVRKEGNLLVYTKKK